MVKNSTSNVLGSLILLLVLSACAAPDIIEQEPIIEVRTIPIEKPAPIVPDVDQLSLNKVEWIIITEENMQDVFDEMRSKNQSVVLFGLTGENYENLSLNLNDLRSNIQQYQSIIAIYEKSYK